MLWVIMRITEIVCMIVAAGYFYILMKRILSLFIPELKKVWKAVLAGISLWLGLLSGNLFSTTGVILVHIVAAAGVIEIVNLIVKKIGKGEKTKWNIIYKSCLLPFLITAVIFTYGYFNIRNVIETDYVITTEKNIPDNKIRVLLVTDSHYGTIFESEKMRELSERMSEIKPDLVVLGGDIVDESTTKEQMKEIFHVWGGIPSTYGIYYVYGNHDRQNYSSAPSYTKEELETAITESGITVLKDNFVEIAEGLTIAGREDVSPVRKSVSDILQGVNQEDYIIVADHQPVEYEENVAEGVDLIVSGHTHAGQIFPSGHVMRIFHTSDLWYGLAKEGNMHAVVSAGIAGWGYPIRTQEHSEFTVIDIQKK